MPLFQLKDLVYKSATMTEVLLSLNLINKGGNFKTLKDRLIKENIDYSHFSQGAKDKRKIRKKLLLTEVLISNSTYNRSHLKARLLKEGILKNICAICSQIPEWNGKPLSLQLDHINGISNDNRLINLRIICPHCHSQSDNFAGRNKKYGILKSKAPKKVRPNKISWPEDIVLLDMVRASSFSAVGRELSVSDNAIRKRLKRKKLI